MEWIKVEDRLPEDMQEVLVFGNTEVNNEKTTYLAIFHKNVQCKDINGKVHVESQFWEIQYGYDMDVTHWMPLPQPPKEK